MAKRFRCPYCHEIHDLMSCRFVCRKDECPNGYQNDDGSIKEENRVYCLNKCQNASVQVLCPKTDAMNRYQRYIQKYQVNKDVPVHLDIPAEFRDGTPTLTVAVLGGVSSGKTSYLTILLNELSNKFGNRFESNLRILNTATQELYRNRYYNFVFIDNGTNEKTPAGDSIPPLLYSLEFANNRGSKQRVNLAFYDVAGEDLRAGEKMEDLGYIATADLLLVLLDPLQMPSVRKKLQGKMSLPDQTEAPTAIIDRLVSVYRAIWKKRGKIQVPVAVAFSKLDVLKETGFFDDGDDSIFKESRHLDQRAFVLDEFNSTGNTMRAIFENYVEGSPVSNLKMNFKNYALFGFSAFGIDPAVSTDLEEDIHPYRVLDPLIWALHSKGYIKKI